MGLLDEIAPCRGLVRAIEDEPGSSEVGAGIAGSGGSINVQQAREFARLQNIRWIGCEDLMVDFVV